ncbi:MAG: type I-B CRISPR-associated protein Cas7/Csh2 [Desulfobacterales bacterium]|nr:type I-B CRISPR-associated protein Cas7/Csh2 [Desulfobacterales bacterium]
MIIPENLVKTNHEFLFIYDAKDCNPNGDPNNENKPRMDEDREINFVSDVRLKRYIRDYLQQFKGKDIYVTKIDGKASMPKKILDNLKQRSKYDGNNEIQFYLNNLIDVRMFGATMAIEGSSGSFTGPIQISWGYSLNKVKINDNGITTHFASTDKNDQGSMGRDPRVNYSLIAFYGNIIAKKCDHTLLTEDDIALFDEAIIKSIPLLSTRSKIGQCPRLYIRIEYNDPEYLNGDLRRLVHFNQKEGLEDKTAKIDTIVNISEITLDAQQLEKKLGVMKNTTLTIDNDEKPLIKHIEYWQHEDLKIKGDLSKWIM